MVTSLCHEIQICVMPFILHEQLPRKSKPHHWFTLCPSAQSHVTVVTSVLPLFPTGSDQENTQPADPNSAR